MNTHNAVWQAIAEGTEDVSLAAAMQPILQNPTLLESLSQPRKKKKGKAKKQGPKPELAASGERLQQLLQFMMEYELSSDYAAPLEQMSLKYYEYDSGIPGGDAVLPDGYHAVLAPLAEELDIRYGATVRQVEYGKGVAVTLADGTRIEGDQAIVTLPLGVLKAG